MSATAIDIDLDVFKLVDSRVDKLAHGRISAEAFALLIQPGDPFVLLGSTVYALTQEEFYRMYPPEMSADLSEDAFKEALYGCNIDEMSEQDQVFIRQARADLPHCPACRYNRYRDRMRQLVHKYSIDVPLDRSSCKYVYPDTTGDIAPKYTRLTMNVKVHVDTTRKPCMDCVEKHLSQAVILAEEWRQGYTEYLPLIAGHLAEAMDELPDGAELIRDAISLFFCKTCHDRVPFVPVGLVCALVKVGSAALTNTPVDEDDTSAQFNIDITDDVRRELADMDATTRGRLLGSCQKADEFIHGVENSEALRISWEGAMANASSLVAQTATETARLLRNRRLMFKAAPELALESGYSCADLIDIMKTC